MGRYFRPKGSSHSDESVHNSSIRCLRVTKCVYNGEKWTSPPCKNCYHMWLEDTQCLK